MHLALKLAQLMHAFDHSACSSCVYTAVAITMTEQPLDEHEYCIGYWDHDHFCKLTNFSLRLVKKVVAPPEMQLKDATGFVVEVIQQLCEGEPSHG